MQLSRIRFADDDPTLYGFRSVERDGNRAFHSRALSQHVRVSTGVLPAVFAAMVRAKERLGIDRPVQAFVYASPDTNAYCCGGRGAGPVLILVSSALVRLVSSLELEFVVGHELGHFMFDHSGYPSDVESACELRLLELRRASELSADRAGLVACQDVEVALQAILKVASGLDAAHLDIDIGEYLRQIRDLQDNIGDESMLYSTHPPFPLRARALLRFDSVLARIRDGEDCARLITTTDDEIRRDMDRAAAGSAGNQFTDVAMGVAFWDAACRVCSDGTLSVHDQSRLAQRFGQEKVEALRRALGARGREEGHAFLDAKRCEAESRLKVAPLFVIRAAEEALRGFQE
jgi:hypothetical protein